MSAQVSSSVNVVTSLTRATTTDTGGDAPPVSPKSRDRRGVGTETPGVGRSPVVTRLSPGQMVVTYYGIPVSVGGPGPVSPVGDIVSVPSLDWDLLSDFGVRDRRPYPLLGSTTTGRDFRVRLREETAASPVEVLTFSVYVRNNLHVKIYFDNLVTYRMSLAISTQSKRL